MSQYATGRIGLFVALLRRLLGLDSLQIRVGAGWPACGLLDSTHEDGAEQIASGDAVLHLPLSDKDARAQFGDEWDGLTSTARWAVRIGSLVHESGHLLSMTNQNRLQVYEEAGLDHGTINLLEDTLIDGLILSSHRRLREAWRTSHRATLDFIGSEAPWKTEGWDMSLSGRSMALLVYTRYGWTPPGEMPDWLQSGIDALGLLDKYGVSTRDIPSKVVALAKALGADDMPDPGDQGQSGQSGESGDQSGQDGQSGDQSGQDGQSGESGDQSGQDGQSDGQNGQDGQSGDQSGQADGQSGHDGQSGDQSGQDGQSDGQSGQDGQSGDQSGQADGHDGSGSGTGGDWSRSSADRANRAVDNASKRGGIGNLKEIAEAGEAARVDDATWFEGDIPENFGEETETLETGPYGPDHVAALDRAPEVAAALAAHLHSDGFVDQYAIFGQPDPARIWRVGAAVTAARAGLEPPVDPDGFRRRHWDDVHGVSIVVAADVSGSMRTGMAAEDPDNAYRQLVKAIDMVAHGLVWGADQVSLGLIAFNGGAKQIRSLRELTDPTDIRRRLYRLQGVRGGTSFDAALWQVHQMIERDWDQRSTLLVLLVTDGEAGSAESEYRAIKTIAPESRIIGVTVGLGQRVSTLEESTDVVVQLDDPAELGVALASAVESVLV